MKTLCIYLLLLVVGLSAAFRPSAAPAYRFDAAASKLTWTDYAEVGSYAPSGSIRLRGGSFEYDGRAVRRGRCEVDMQTLTHEISQMQDHLRSDDFFAVKRFPTAVFELDRVADGQAEGRLTLRGITKPLRFSMTVTPQPGGELRLQGAATVDRTQFDVKTNSSSFFQNLGNQAIRNDFKLEFDALARPIASSASMRVR
jgi:polyisoprenoid-binding protein YceI